MNHMKTDYHGDDTSINFSSNLGSHLITKFVKILLNLFWSTFHVIDYMQICRQILFVESIGYVVYFLYNRILNHDIERIKS